MSESTDATVDRPAIRRAVRAVVAGQPVDKRETISEVAGQLDSREAIVREELNELERHGFIYLVGDGDDAEVRLP
jgi:hypothetical protein